MLSICRLCKEMKDNVNYLKQCLDCGLKYENCKVNGLKYKLPTIIMDKYNIKREEKI